MTPAQRQAEFLSALSAHLFEHPDLEPVEWIQDDGTLHLPVLSSGGQGARMLAAWFRSVDAVDLRARAVDHEERPYAEVWAGGVTIGGLTVPRLWGPVVGLGALLAGREPEPGEWRRHVPLSIAELEHFAEHGTLPGGAR